MRERLSAGLARRIVLIGLAGIQGLGTWASSQTSSNPGKTDALAKLPLSFEANHGQADPSVEFLARKATYNVFLTATEAVLSFENPGGRAESWASIRLIGACANRRVHAEDRLPGTSSYFFGNDPKAWHTNIPTYAKVRYEEVYPGVALVYYGHDRELEYDFVLAPGADPQAIRLALDGVDHLALNGNGDLVMATPGGQLRWHRPHVYQDVNGVRRPITADYRLAGEREVAFQLGKYDHSAELVIDPVMVFATYLGGSGNDGAFGIAVDADGNTYVAGQTGSPDFPLASGFSAPAPYSTFVVKLNAAGSALLYSAFFGGLGGNGAPPAAIAVDSAGNAYVTGYVSSPNLSMVNAAQPKFGNAYAVKLNPSGSGLVYSTYLGGTNGDMGTAIAVDPSGSAYVTGITYSADFPVVHALQPSRPAAPGSAFVTKLSATGAFVYSTYLGGEGGASGYGIAADAKGNAYVTGMADRGFPTANAFKATSDGSQDAFVTKIDPTGSQLIYSTLLGGSSSDEGHSIAVDASGNAYIAGFTYSHDFPIAGGLHVDQGCCKYAFVTKLNAAGSGLIYSTLLGGSGDSWASAVAPDSAGNAYVAGLTSTTDFPAVHSLNLPSGSDVFLAKLNPEGSALAYSTFFREMGGPFAFVSLAVDRSGNAYLAGAVRETAPTTPGALQGTLGGGVNGYLDAYIVKIGDQPGPKNPAPSVTSIFPPNVKASSLAFTLTVAGANFINGSTVLWNGAIRATTLVSSTELRASISSDDIRSGGFAQVTVFNPGGELSNVVPFRIENPVPSIQSISGLFPSGLLFKLGVQGSNFARGAVVSINGVLRNTVDSSWSLEAELLASDLAGQTRPQIAVVNPGPGGGMSNTIDLDLSPPVIDSVSPNPVILPSTSAFTIKGSNFNLKSQIRLNGDAAYYTNFVSSTEITTTGLAGPPGTVQVAVWNSSPPYGLSNTIPVTVFGEVNNFSTASWKGGYVFSMEGTVGTSSAKVPVAIVGRLVADGEGAITSGTMDYLDPAGVVHSDLSGTYSIASSGLGEGSVDTSLGTFRFNLVVLSGSRGTIQLNSPLGSGLTAIASGEIEKQEVGDLSASGDYVFSLQGFTVASWMSAAGRFTADGAGGISNGVEDINDTGRLSNTPFGGTYTLDADGRGTADLAGAGGPSRFIIYAVSGNKLMMISTDPSAVVSGEAERQDLGPFSNASLRGNYGFLLKGFSATTWDVFLARFTADGEGGISGGLADRNSSGAVTEDVPFGGTYEVSSNGRGQLTLDGWPGGMRGVFYLASRGRGVFVQLSPTSAAGGAIEAQQSMTFTPASLIKTLGFALDGFTANQPWILWGDLVMDGEGRMAGSTFAGGNSFSGTYTISPDGRGNMAVVGGYTPRRAFVALSPSKLMMVTLDTAVLAGYAEEQVNVAPRINEGGIVNSADLREGGGPGMLMTLFGDALTSATAAASPPLPTTLAGVQVLVGRVAAPLYFVSPHQIVFQIPWEQARIGVSVVVDGAPSNPQVLYPRDPSPGIFTLDQSAGGPGAIVIAATGEVVAPSGSIAGRATRPAHPGEFVSIYCTGLGAVSNHPASGAPASADQLSPTTVTPLVSIGGRAAWVTFSGLAPGLVGVYWVTVQVPSDVPHGATIPVYLVMPPAPGFTEPGAVASMVVTMAID